MPSNTFYNEVLIDHNMHPMHYEKLDDANIMLEGVNPSCGDDLVIQFRVEDGVIQDGAFAGDGCAISKASADIMIDMVIGKTTEEALHLSELFVKMIQGQCSPEEIDELEEAGALQDISHMPARVKCAVLGWRTMEDALKSKMAK